MSGNPELALGTVQFGTKYGVAGRGEVVPDAEVRDILIRAWELGIRVLDTAPAYGDIEQRLSALAGQLAFGIVSKIPPVPPDADAAAVSAAVARSIRQSRERLGERLHAVLFHRGEDLLGGSADIAWRAASDTARECGVRVGASFYSPDAAASVRASYPLQLAQLPGNALDQRLAQASAAAALTDVEVHLRSIFLQGLLLMPRHGAVERVPAAAAALGKWTEWCERRSVNPLRAALSIARSLPRVRYCVVGVDRVSQLEEIVAAWSECEALHAPALASDEQDVIDPRCWKTA